MIELENAAVRLERAPMLAPTTARIGPGESVALRGGNGSGKTTLLRLIAGKLAPTSGTVRVAGDAPHDRNSTFRRLLAGSLGLPPFARDLTLREHAALIGTTWGLSLRDASSNADERLSELGLDALANRFPHELSSGQTQLAGLALTLSRPFDVLLLDEPEQRLDSAHLGAVVTALHRVRQSGATLIIATHSDPLAAAITDRSITLAAA